MEPLLAYNLDVANNRNLAARQVTTQEKQPLDIADQQVHDLGNGGHVGQATGAHLSRPQATAVFALVLNGRPGKRSRVVATELSRGDGVALIDHRRSEFPP